MNILKGDMSIVGPRLLLASYLELYDERQRKRHKVRPELTGLHRRMEETASAGRNDLKRMYIMWSISHFWRIGK